MYRKVKKIPTLLGLLLLFLVIGSFVVISPDNMSLQSSASPKSQNNEELPQDIHINSVTDNSFTVSYLTAIPLTGKIIVTGNKKSIELLDDSDTDKVPRPRTTHYFTVRNLAENTSYSIKIESGRSCKNNCPEYEQKTAGKINLNNTLPPIRGTVKTKDGQPAAEALVYVVVGKSMPLAGRTDKGGLFAIPLTNIRGENFSGIEIADSDLIQVDIKTSVTDITSAVTNIKNVRMGNIPEMKIGETYNFVDMLTKNINQQVLGSQTTNSVDAGNKFIKPDIIFPKADNDVTTDNQPKLRGIGIPGSQMTITVNSTPQTGKVIVDKDGTWSWRPTKPLPPGIHYLNIQGYDAKGKSVSVKRKFLVLKSGEQVLGDATPSASITPTIFISPTIPAIISPTTVIIPTYSYPSPTVIVSPPRSGNNPYALFLLGGSAALLFFGIKFLMHS